MVKNKTPKLELLVLCDHALASQDGKLNLFGIFDRIFTKQIPSLHPKMFVAAILVGEPKVEHSVKLRIISPNNKDLLEGYKETNVSFSSTGRANFLSELNNLPLPASGTYKVELLSDGAVVGTIEFSVMRMMEADGGKEKKVH